VKKRITSWIWFTGPLTRNPTDFHGKNNGKNLWFPEKHRPEKNTPLESVLIPLPG
jgi:hypothetical protein